MDNGEDKKGRRAREKRVRKNTLKRITVSKRKGRIENNNEEQKNEK